MRPTAAPRRRATAGRLSGRESEGTRSGMLLHVPGVFNKDEVAHLRSRLDAGPWADGNVTSGHQSATAKVNRQLPEESAEAREVGALVLQALNAHPMFVSAALPHTVFPPLFNRYEGGEHFGVHVDNAIRPRATAFAATFRPVVISRAGRLRRRRLIVERCTAPVGQAAAGDYVLYPSKSLHRVTPVTRGARVASSLDPEPRARRRGSRDPVPARRGIQRVSAEKGSKEVAVLELTASITTCCGPLGRGLNLVDVATVATRPVSSIRRSAPNAASSPSCTPFDSLPDCRKT